jgi:hypothetical protein
MSQLSGSQSADNNGKNSSSTNNNSSSNSSSNNNNTGFPRRYALRRLRNLVEREGITWVEPIHEQDGSLLGTVAYNVDMYIMSEEYDRDCSERRELLVTGDIMLATGAKAKQARMDWAARRMTLAFDEAVWLKANAAEEKERKEASGEASLRAANYVDAALDDFEMGDDEVDLADFEEEFGQDIAAQMGEMGLGLEPDEEIDEEIGAEFGEMDLGE